MQERYLLIFHYIKFDIEKNQYHRTWGANNTTNNNNILINTLVIKVIQ